MQVVIRLAFATLLLAAFGVAAVAQPIGRDTDRAEAPGGLVPPGRALTDAEAAAIRQLLAEREARAQATGQPRHTVGRDENIRGIESIVTRLAKPNEESAQVLEELLHPIDTSSPRDTILSFLRLTQRYYDLLHQVEFTAAESTERQRLFDQMQGFFDLRNVPPSLHQDVAVAAAVYLREVIDRIGLPPVEEIPDREQMLAAEQAGGPPAWRIGNVRLEIVAIDTGPQQGRYLFSDETLRSVKDLFHEVRSFPYRDESAAGFYRAYFLTPHPALRAWADALPAWTQRDILEQTVWQWLGMLLAFVLAIALIWLLWGSLKRLTRNASSLARSSTMLLAPLFGVLVSVALYNVLNDKIFITGEVFRVAVYAIYGIALTAAIVFIFSLGTVLSDLMASSEHTQRRAADVHLARLSIRVLSIIVIIVVLLEGMRLIGFSLATILAGAGVTGLAVALAAQNTLRNIFGSLMLLLDKPFEIGQRIKIGNHEGFVEQIGMRSTKLRLLNGHLVSIPNEKLADVDIENVDQRPSIRRVMNVTVTYDTSLDKLQRAVAVLREILAVPDHPLRPVDMAAGSAAWEPHPNEAINHPGRPPRVFFNDLNPDSLNIIVFYWYSPAIYWEYLEHAQYINSEIMRRFREEGIEFAFPTQTVHLNSDQLAPVSAGELLSKDLSPST